MKKLLNTLYITSEDAYLGLENENVVVFKDGERIGMYPLLMFQGIVSFSRRGASPSLMGECCKRCINLAFMTPNGRLLARASGETQGNLLLRKEQYRISDCSDRSCAIARHFQFGKIYNQRWVLERTLRDHALRVDASAIEAVSRQLQSALATVLDMTSLDSLRGLEGEASARYFSVFNHLILNQKDDFHFDGRNRRPPEDRVNALLSFLYAILTNDCAAALEGVGLDAYAGFMHRDRPGRRSLGLDLMEELRAPYVDRLVLTLINTKEVQARHFTKQPGGAVLLNDDGRKAVLSAWQTRKKEEITHPFLKEKVEWGLVPHVQAMLLARYIRGDMDGYPPFLWK